MLFKIKISGTRAEAMYPKIFSEVTVCMLIF